MTTREKLENIGGRLTLPQMQMIKKQIERGDGKLKSLAGREVRVVIDDFEVMGKIVGTDSKFPMITICSGYEFEVSFTSAYKAVYMNQIIRL